MEVSFSLPSSGVGVALISDSFLAISVGLSVFFFAVCIVCLLFVHIQFFFSFFLLPLFRR